MSADVRTHHNNVAADRNTARPCDTAPPALRFPAAAQISGAFAGSLQTLRKAKGYAARVPVSRESNPCLRAAKSLIFLAAICLNYLITFHNAFWTRPKTANFPCSSIGEALMNKPRAGRTSSELRRVADLVLGRAALTDRHRQRSWAPPHASTAHPPAHNFSEPGYGAKGFVGSRPLRMLRSYRSWGELCYTEHGNYTRRCDQRGSQQFQRARLYFARFVRLIRFG